MGIVLVSISAILFASWFASESQSLRTSSSKYQRQFAIRKKWRRLVANGLVGFVGVALMMFDAVPRTPIAITAYLLCLVFTTAWIMLLGFADWRASRQFHEELQLEQLAMQLQKSPIAEKLTAEERDF